VSLQGLSILVVEDEALVAVMVEDMLVDLGARVVGPASTLTQGIALAATAALDAAVLDVTVRGEPVTHLADVLRRSGVPMVFATGYGEAPEGQHQDVPVLEKPYTREDLHKALAAALAARELTCPLPDSSI
jgi:CheY-like chemotaxis protein